jgi:LmbE family N-acetylglucosaminyl deacetylase
MRKIIVVSVHPDDETLGCGGTLFKHKSMGDILYCIHVTNGNKEQEKIITKLQSMYEFRESIQLGFEEVSLETVPLSDIIEKVSAVIKSIKPDYLYIPNRSDVHSDHRRVFEALVACTKAFRYPYIKKTLMCEVISETDFSPALYEMAFVPNVFVDITDFINKKNEVIKLFEKELLPSPFTRSLTAIEALGRYRGSQINVEYAEAFMLIKEIL